MRRYPQLRRLKYGNLWKVDVDKHVMGIASTMCAKPAVEDP